MPFLTKSSNIVSISVIRIIVLLPNFEPSLAANAVITAGDEVGSL